MAGNPAVLLPLPTAVVADLERGNECHCRRGAERGSGKIQQIINKDSWLLQQDLAWLHVGIQQAVDALPLPVARLEAFDDCREPWRQCREWLDEGAQRVAMRNQ